MYEIPIRRLLHLWLAEGFVETLTKVTSVVPEDVAQSYLEGLVCRNMIEIARKKLDGSPKTCRLPCFLHDVFLSKAEDIGFLHVHHGQSDCTPKSNFVVRRLADQYFGVKSTSEYHTQKLCSYLSFETQKRNTSNREIETLLKLITRKRSSAFLLKVFDLENIYRPVLPDKLGKKMYYCPGDFPELHVLKLWMLENLEEWWVEKGGLPKLEEMEIRGCGKLKRFDGLEHLPILKELVLTNMQPEFVADVGRRINARGGQNLVQRGTSSLKKFQAVLPPVRSTVLV
ncbi:hypothetical protein RHMOL_Rhmol09G0055600 [Rhododendron molle]|uniref:Uncharacterized protein n=1 Tax=Rhododendron molle TaxID=49168 RepID=A0ACC0MBA5_RHOML|nr:hypothetical protein RHMOL_Rhmol09G0055600 [Rhododendron molle]